MVASAERGNGMKRVLFITYDFIIYVNFKIRMFGISSLMNCDSLFISRICGTISPGPEPVPFSQSGPLCQLVLGLAHCEW